MDKNTRVPPVAVRLLFNFPVNFHCSGAKNGFAISSNPSTGFRTVIVGPRRTAKPRDRMCGSGTEARVNGDVRVTEAKNKTHVAVPP